MLAVLGAVGTLLFSFSGPFLVDLGQDQNLVCVKQRHEAHQPSCAPTMLHLVTIVSPDGS